MFLDSGTDDAERFTKELQESCCINGLTPNLKQHTSLYVLTHADRLRKDNTLYNTMWGV